MSERNAHEPAVGFLARAKWFDEANGGGERVKLLYELGVFSSEERMQMFIDHLNGMERRVFGNDALFFYDYCVYHALTADVPF